VRALVAIAILLIATPLRAETALRLPLDGYFRPGRCMPVMIQTNSSGLTLNGDGIVPTEVAAGRSGVVPVLVLSSIAGPLNDLPLRALGENERLVASTSSDDGLAAKLFPEQSIVNVHIEPADLLTAAPLAWHALDAVVLDRAPEPKKLAALLANGTVVAVRSDDRPDRLWPWERSGEYWLLRIRLSGSAGAIWGDAVALPAVAWHPVMPTLTRLRIVLVGVIVILVLLGTLLTGRPRTSILVTLAMSLVSCAGIEIWRRQLPAIRTASGQIVITDEQGLEQRDRWDYLTAPGGASGLSDGSRMQFPALRDGSQAKEVSLRLICSADGADRWSYRIPPRETLAFVLRTVVLPDGIPLGLSTSTRSPLQELARQAYLRPGARIIGELEWGSRDPMRDHWPHVVIQVQD
jgi:hypothetical protein